MVWPGPGTPGRQAMSDMLGLQEEQDLVGGEWASVMVHDAYRADKINTVLE